MKKFSIISILLCLLLIPSIGITAQKEYGSATLNHINSVYDGDTFRATVNWWPRIIGDDMSIRIRNVNTPEIGGRAKCDKERKLGQKAKTFTNLKLVSASKVRIKNMVRGSFFRIVAYVLVDGENLGDQLVAAGLGVYGTTSKYDWCN